MTPEDAKTQSWVMKTVLTVNSRSTGLQQQNCLSYRIV